MLVSASFFVAPKVIPDISLEEYAELRVPADAIELGAEIGRGGYATIYKV